MIIGQNLYIFHGPETQIQLDQFIHNNIFRNKVVSLIKVALEDVLA